VTEALTRLPRADGPASPAAVGRVLLTWIEAWWEERQDTGNPDAPQPLPGQRYLAGGDPRTIAWDHDDGQVTVTADRLITGIDPTTGPPAVRSPRANPANAGSIGRRVVYEVQIIRPAPSLSFAGSIPGGSAIDAHGYLTMSDMGHLVQCLADALRAGILLREHVGQGATLLGDAEALGPSGGLAGVACGLTVPLL